MKKRNLINYAVLITTSLTVLSNISCNNSKQEITPSITNNDVAINTSAKNKIEEKIETEFIYEIGPRFSPVKKSVIDNAKYMYEVFDFEQLQRVVNLYSVSIIPFIDEKRSDIHETSHSYEFNDAQLKLLRSADYSSNFIIRVDFQEKKFKTGYIEDNYTTPHFTIVPEKQAEYANGKNELIKYLELKSKDVRKKANVEAEKLQPAKLYFTVTKNGTIEDVRLDRTSNYPLVDKEMAELVRNAPGIWIPAENINGKKVDQELVVSFGLIGC